MKLVNFCVLTLTICVICPDLRNGVLNCLICSYDQSIPISDEECALGTIPPAECSPGHDRCAINFEKDQDGKAIGIHRVCAGVTLGKDYSSSCTEKSEKCSCYGDGCNNLSYHRVFNLQAPLKSTQKPNEKPASSVKPGEIGSAEQSEHVQTSGNNNKLPFLPLIVFCSLAIAAYQ